MAQWWKFSLGDAMLATVALDELTDTLNSIYQHRQEPTLLALYRHESQGLHCHLIIYLTNNFKQLVPLDYPVQAIGVPPSDASFLAGNPSILLAKE